MKKIPKEIRVFLSNLSMLGESYLVGGCVRDLYLGIEPNDYDVCTNVSLDIIEKHWKTFDIGKNKDFGIVVVQLPYCNIEVAKWRIDGAYGDGRHPDSVTFTNSVKDDVERRDFTINSLLMDEKGNIIDHFGGIADINAGIIRTVGDPQVRFAEDYLRMLRCVRFSTRFDFKIEKKTWQAIVDNAPKIHNISVERVWQELWKMVKTDGYKFASAIMMMADSGLLHWILPEIDGMRGRKHCFQHHPEGDVFQHVMAAVASNCEVDNPILNLAILFHDVGKNDQTYKFRDGWKHSYFNHDVVGRDMMDKIAKQLTIPNDVRDAIKFACEKHMMFHKLKDVRSSKVLSWMDSPYWDIAVAVAKADTFSRGETWGTRDWSKVEERLQHIKTLPSVKNTRQVVNGVRVMNIRGIGPSKIVGKIIKATVDAIGDGIIENNDEAIDQFIKDFK